MKVQKDSLAVTTTAAFFLSVCCCGNPITKGIDQPHHEAFRARIASVHRYGCRNSKARYNVQ